MGSEAPGLQLHPVVSEWFRRRFPAGATPPQEQGWPAIRAGGDTLIAAPTGSGKTLTGFLMAIDRLYREGVDMSSTPRTRVVYVSPLKALAVDVHGNLERPLAEMRQIAEERGEAPPAITVAVRTGDTPASARTAMLTRPPTILVTTPESLYLLVTSARGRTMLATTETVIGDEIHAQVRDKRGSHLALTLERLDRLVVGPRPQRIGLSATQRPIDQTARLLTGVGTGRSATVVDCGQRRDLQVSIELPGTELSAVASTEQLGEVLDRIAAHVADHRTTLVFVNTRRMSERLAHLLADRLGSEQVAAHHGSLSKERRQRVEERLRAGELRALVATASLELGIDIGPVELVCQVGSPRSIATFLQRVGRSNHSRSGVPHGILYPLSRDELVECAALLAAVRAGDLDRTIAPVAPLDILAQQVVAEVAASEEWDERELVALIRQAAPYAELSDGAYEDVLELVSEGITTGRGRRMAYVHRDRVNGMLRPRRGARIAALTSGGAIAEVGDYRVVLDPDEVTVGTVNEDFAVESMAGDVFLLGTHSWRVRRVEQGVVRVVDAEGANPTVPFWLGEAPSRTDELSHHVSELRRRVGTMVAELPADLSADPLAPVRRGVGEHCGIDEGSSRQVVEYLAAGLAGLGVLPTHHDIVFERFFDEAGGTQLVVHAPFGGRINRAFGLALRKRFCATFDFELQAAASDDAVVLSLGPQHSFPVGDAAKLLRSTTAPAVLSQAVLVSPMFASRWRWNLNRSLGVLRFRGGRRTPLPIQRMEADDLMGAVFPALAACQENAPAGPIQIPDHVLVRQTLDDCLHEAMDIDGLCDRLRGMEDGSIRVHAIETTEPSVLAQEILNGKPYTFLDDAPLEERRTRAVQMRRGVPLEPGNLGRLDDAAILRVRHEAAPDIRTAEELHDLLLSVIVLRSEAACAGLVAELRRAGRVGIVRVDGGATELWVATERLRWIGLLWPDATFDPADVGLAAGLPPEQDPDQLVAEVLRGHLDVAGPVTAGHLAHLSALPSGRVGVGLARLEAEGFAMQGHFDSDPGTAGRPGEVQWCARRLLARIHAYTRNRLRNEIEPVSAQDLMRFLLRWQHVAPGTQRQGRLGVLSVVDQLQGFEVAAGAWEQAVLPSRIEHYQGAWLEDACLSGALVWGRLGIRPPSDGPSAARGSASPSRSTPVSFAARDDLPWLLLAARGGALPLEPAHGAGRDILDALRRYGALFHNELGARTGRLPVEVEEGLWDLVARGLVTADGFGAVRSLLSARETWQRRHRHTGRRTGGRRRTGTGRVSGEGRWALLPGPDPDDEPDSLAEAVAEQLLARWGVVFWDLMARESLAVPWRDIARALRRLEARGVVRGGRFVTGFAGEQFALPEALEGLRGVRRLPRSGEVVVLNATDPLNLVGIVLPGPRIPAVRTNQVAYLDGALVGADDPTGATVGGVASEPRSDGRSLA